MLFIQLYVAAWSIYFLMIVGDFYKVVAEDLSHIVSDMRGTPRTLCLCLGAIIGAAVFSVTWPTQLGKWISHKLKQQSNS